MVKYYEMGGTEAMLAAIDDIDKEFHLSKHDLNVWRTTTVEKFEALENGVNPTNLWDYIACGSYKEAYWADAGDFIIKLARYDNYTEQELHLIEIAAEEGVADIFVPTYAIPVANGVLGDFISIIDKPETHIEFLLIQPNVGLMVRDSAVVSESFPLKFPTLHKDYLLLGISSTYWMETVMDRYGEEFSETFVEFGLQNGLTDLHGENIGWRMTNGVPIPAIFDWVSD